MIFFSRLILSLGLLYFPISVKAQNQNTIINLMGEIINDFDFLFEKGVHPHDRPRIYMMKNVAQKSLDRYVTRPISMKTYEAVFMLHLRYKRSEQFFNFIKTGYNKDTLKSLESNFSTLAYELELESSGFTTIVASALISIQESLSLLLKERTIEQGLRYKISNLIPVLGNGIAIAKVGDNRPTFNNAEKLYFEIKKLYTDLEPLSASKLLVHYYMEIIGQNEFLRDYIKF
jgi:hypothetical protein